MARTRKPDTPPLQIIPAENAQIRPYLRRCWRCGYPMAPTGRKAIRMHFWRCGMCSKEKLWADTPVIIDANTTIRSAVHLDQGGYCCTSMFEDPDCKVVRPEEPKAHKFPNPYDSPIGDPVFSVGKTHRWNWTKFKWRELRRSA